MMKNSIYAVAAFLAISCMLTQVSVQAAPKKAEPAKLNHGTTVKHIERDITGAAKHIENKIEEHGVKKYKAKVKQDELNKQKK